MFLNPLGLLALSSLIPLIILYIIKPDPRKLEIPTVDFLPNFSEEGGSNPIIETLRRNLLLLLQILALILLSLSLATPYIEVSRSAQIDDTVIVLDATASMATKTGGGTRFSEAVSMANSKVTSTTSIVVVGSSSNVVLDRGSAQEARTILDSVSVTDTDGDLQSGISQGVSLANEESRVLVLSDFADDSNWNTPVQSARARGIMVQLEQFNGGGESNIGITDLSFQSNSVTATIENFGEEQASTNIQFGGSARSLDLNPGDIQTETFNVPIGTNVMEISSSDSFPTDDRTFITAYSKRQIDVLMVTNEGNRFLETAFSSMNEVDLQIKNPPVGSLGNPDVVVFTEVNPGRLLDRTVRNARQVAEQGGGVVVQSQTNLEDITDIYGDLLLIDPKGLQTSAGVNVVSDHQIIRGISFSPPGEYITGNLRHGRSLINSSDQSPLIAISEFGAGSIMYDGFIKDSSDFKYNYLYPVFWKRSLYHLSGRERLSTINMETGSTLNFPNTVQVNTPKGSITSNTVVMNDAGFYSTEQRTVSANLISPSESDINSEPIEESQVVQSGGGGTETEMVPQELTYIAVLLALIIVFSEIIFMKYRGDI